MLSDADAVWQPRRQHWGVRQRRKVPGATRIGAEMRWHGHRQYPPTPPGTLSDLNASRPLTNSGSWPRLCRWIMAMLQGGIEAQAGTGTARCCCCCCCCCSAAPAAPPPSSCKPGGSPATACTRMTPPLASTHRPERREGHQLLPCDRVQRPRVQDVDCLQPTRTHTGKQASVRQAPPCPLPQRLPPAPPPTPSRPPRPPCPPHTPWRAPGSR